PLSSTLFPTRRSSDLPFHVGHCGVRERRQGLPGVRVVNLEDRLTLRAPKLLRRVAFELRLVVAMPGEAVVAFDDDQRVSSGRLRDRKSTRLNSSHVSI